MTIEITDLKLKMINEQTLPMPGWNKILTTLDRRLTILDPSYKIFQIKEKFGELRFYYQSEVPEIAVREAMDRYVNYAIEESKITCEFCGSSGTLMNMNGWFKTVCQECFDKNEK